MTCVSAHWDSDRMMYQRCDVTPVYPNDRNLPDQIDSLDLYITSFHEVYMYICKYFTQCQGYWMADSCCINDIFIRNVLNKIIATFLCGFITCL